MSKEFKLPNLGEGVAAGEVVAISVKAGDAVTKGQTMLEVQTDKAVSDVTAPEDGKIVSVAVKTGDKVKPGQVMVTYDAAAGDAAAAPAAKGTTAPAAPAAKASAPAAKTAAPATPLPAPAPVGPAAKAEVKTVGSVAAAAPAPTGGLVAASPGVRKFARELGVDLTTVTGSGNGGRILEQDVKDHVKRILAHGGGAASSAGGGGISQPAMPDFAKWGAVERLPLKGVRKATADGMARNWALIPHVTQFDVADITETEAARKKFAEKRKGQPGKVTMTILAIKAVTKALSEFPQFASSIDTTAGDGGEIIRKSYRHIGIAVDSPNGLMVPVVRDTDKKGLTTLATELEGLAEKVRSRKIALEDMQGSVFTISNLGGIGGTFFTPIVNWPEVAILGMSKSRQELQMIDGKIEQRLMMGLSLSYDHRVIDGADGARFLKRVCEILNDPFDLLS
jgi:pyruvate dehydrogenase E2 component (dihydrolipoamide acetyltransferase)